MTRQRSDFFIGKAFFSQNRILEAISKMMVMMIVKTKRHFTDETKIIKFGGFE